MPNLYVSLETFKGTGAMNVTSTAYDGRLLALIDGVSRQVDRFTNRQFYYFVGTRHFDGPGGGTLWIGDVVSVSTLLEDTNLDGTYETGWAAADYEVYPYDADPTSRWGGPYTRLIVNTRSNGSQDEFLKAQKNYRVVGTWGYSKMTLDSGRDGSGTLGSTATSFVLDGVFAGTIDIGHTVLVDDELMFVRGTGAGGTALTVDRAQNGSTGTAHSTANVHVIVFPEPVTEAAFIQAARLWKRKDAAFGPEMGMTETGQLRVFTGLDPDVKMLLGPYRRHAA